MGIIILQLKISIILACLLINSQQAVVRICGDKLARTLQALQCVPGLVRNQTSRSGWTGCRCFCSYQCCLHPTCQKFYTNVCKLVLSDSTNESTTAVHTYDTISISPIPQTVVSGVPVSHSTTSTDGTQTLLTRSSEMVSILDIVNATENHESLIKLSKIAQEENIAVKSATSILPVNAISPAANKFNVIAITFIITGALMSLALATFIYILRIKRPRVVYVVVYSYIDSF